MQNSAIRETVTDGISRRVTSGSENTSLIVVDHRIKVTDSCYHNMTLLLLCIRSQVSSSHDI